MNEQIPNIPEKHPKLNGEFHTLLAWLVILSGLFFLNIFYQAQTFEKAGGRFTACDYELHLTTYHDGHITQVCIDRLIERGVIDGTQYSMERRTSE